VDVLTSKSLPVSRISWRK